MTVPSGNGQPYNYNYNFSYGQTYYTPPPAPVIVVKPTTVAYSPPTSSVPVPIRTYGQPNSPSGNKIGTLLTTSPVVRETLTRDTGVAPTMFRGNSQSKTLSGDSVSGSLSPKVFPDSKITHPADLAFNLIDPQNRIGQLQNDGDMVVLRTVFEGKLNVGPGIPYVAQANGGVKGQYGGELRISQMGSGEGAVFVVDVEKQTLAALTGDLSIFEQGVGAELGVQPLDSVEMTFATREDAVRATRIVQRVAFADGISDGSAIGVPTSTSPGSGFNPAANPLNGDGEAGYLANKVSNVSAQDMQFLTDNVTAYESTIGLRGRLKADGEIPIPGFNIEFEGRIDPRQQMTRRIELPTETEAGRVSYSTTLDARVSAKEKVHIANSLMAQNRLELGTARATLTAHYKIPAGTDVTASPATGRPLPEADLLRNANYVPDGFTVERQIEWRDDTFLTASRGNSNRATFTYEVADVNQLSTAFDHVLAGDPAAAAASMGVRARAELVSIERDGLDIQGGLKVDTKVIGGVEGTVIHTVGLDRISGTRAIEFNPNAQAAIDQLGLGDTQAEAPIIAKEDTFTGSFQVENEGVITIDGSGSIPGVAEHAYLKEKFSSEFATNQDVVVPYVPGDLEAPVVDRTGAKAITARADLSVIQRDYQVPSEKSIAWEPNLNGREIPDGLMSRGGRAATWLGDRLGIDSLESSGRRILNNDHQMRVTQSEADALNELSLPDQVKWGLMANDVTSRAPELILREYPGINPNEIVGNDDHADAARHALWNARMTSEFGEEWTARFATSHEKILLNPEAREAMDLYNNEVGRQIAIDNPDATVPELENLVVQSLANGELLVIDRNLEISWSDQVRVNETGNIK